MVKFRNTKSGEARGIKPKVKYRLQLCWVMPAQWVMLLSQLSHLLSDATGAPCTTIQSRSSTGCQYTVRMVWYLCQLSTCRAGESEVSTITPSMSYQPKLIWYFKIAPKIRKHPQVNSLNWIAYVFFFFILFYF